MSTVRSPQARPTCWLVFLALSLSLPALAAERPAALLEAFRTATGGKAWDTVKATRATGTLAVGGMSGPIASLEDLPRGASRSEFDLGAFKGAQGFDGERAWSRDPGGEIRFPDGAEDRAQAASQAWITRRAWWYPERQAAEWGTVETRSEGGRDWQVVEARPAGGNPLTLWFARDTRRLERIVSRESNATVTTTLGDWRAVEGLTLPFSSVADRGDPRSRVTVSLAEIKLNPALEVEAFAAPVAQSKSRIVDAGGSTRVPFDLRNHHIYADALIDGHKVRMLVDTGGVNIVTPAAAARLGLKTEGKLAAQGVGEQQADFSLAKASLLKFGGAELEAPVLFVLELADLAQIEGEPIDGILGYEMFHHFGVRIDYAGGTLTLNDPAQFKAPPGATALPFTLADRIPVVEGQLDGLPVKISIDTGSRASLTMHAPFVHRHQLVQRYRGGSEGVMGFGVGGPSRGIPVRMGTLELGGLQIAGIAGDLFTGEKGAFASDAHGANMGSGLLQRFTVSFDYAARRMYLEPNARFPQADHFDRSGLWLKQDTAEALRIIDIADDSAAALAAQEVPALKVGRRVKAIDGEQVSARHLSEWRARLRDPARKMVALTLEGVDLPVRIHLKDRIDAQWQP